MASGNLERRLRSTRWRRSLTYPVAGALLAVATLAGLLTLEISVGTHAPSLASVVREIQAQPLVYGYLLLATLVVMAPLGWILGRKEDLLEQMTVTDPLTGLANRRRLRPCFAAEISRAARYGTPVALLLVDLDRLKAINDKHGHAAGDRALQIVADGLRQSCRATDLPARYGGDEFVVLAVNTTATEALALAQRIRAHVRRLGLGRHGTGARLSVSVGVADLERAATADVDGLHAAADRALYRAKAEGRDRAALAPVQPRGARLKLVGPDDSPAMKGRPDCEAIGQGVSKGERGHVHALPPTDPEDKVW
jgi:diguanylate cyclase (GGDEF)-like protein